MCYVRLISQWSSLPARTMENLSELALENISYNQIRLTFYLLVVSGSSAAPLVNWKD